MARGISLKPWYQSKTLTILVVLWALFTACLGIMIVVIFVQPHWITGKADGKSVNFGLYRNCSDDLSDCSGSLNEFANIHSSAWKASTVFVAFSFISTFVSVAIMLIYWLCCFRSSGFGFRVSSGMQFSAGKCHTSLSSVSRECSVNSHYQYEGFASLDVVIPTSDTKLPQSELIRHCGCIFVGRKFQIAMCWLVKLHEKCRLL